MALPPQFHAESAIRAVQAGKDVLVEKPVALTVADAERAVKAAREARCVFMVGHVLRFHPAFERLKALIDAGELGEVRYIHSHRLGLGKFHTENDALWDLAPHDLSMIVAIARMAPTCADSGVEDAGACQGGVVSGVVNSSRAARAAALSTVGVVIPRLDRSVVPVRMLSPITLPEMFVVNFASLGRANPSLSYKIDGRPPDRAG